MHAVRFVLLHPRSAENVGAVARALKNFGHRDWTIVGELPPDEAASRRMAVQSEDVLAIARKTQTFEEAVADCAWVVGTNSRRQKGRRRLSPRAFASEAAERLEAGPVALVFGEERSGMSNEEIDRCHDLSAVPTDDAQPSLNLAQAVMLYAYELRLAAEVPPASAPAQPIAATDREHVAIAGALTGLLKTAQFLGESERHAVRDLLFPLERSRLTRDEARLWMAALMSVRKALSRRAIGDDEP